MEHQTEHPLIDGLFRCLPEPGANWPYEERLKWMKAAESITDILYQKPLDEPAGAAVVVALTPNAELTGTQQRG